MSHMDETTSQTTTTLDTEQTVFVVEQNGYLTGPHPDAPDPAKGQTVHETAGFIHAWDHDRDWFECPHCRDEIRGEELKFHEDGHDCPEPSGLDR